ncbi:GIY-YIG nuclease family protein [Nocardioides sp. Root190]|uniref:GIY-YIG nuclease family protein n=1 Tax=Nocardioides sp. Root190 TaxID=1736488 RepID=UPI0009EC1D54|nr:GIY-YIG nuclease family protein [Nocardioides sp. Root190]
MAYVYLLRCGDGSYYVGSTRSLEHRIHQHHVGAGAEYTRRRRPVELVWVGEYSNIGDAFFWEKRIQGWSRAKREALIRGDYDALPGLSRKDFSRSRAGEHGEGLDTPSPRGSDYSTNDHPSPPPLVE